MANRSRRTLALVMIVLLPATALAEEATTKEAVPDPMAKRWSKDRANRWYEGVGAIRGCNFLPSTASNTTELWQAETFDPKAIDAELRLAAASGYNSIRVFIQYLVWRADPEGLKKRIDRFLSIAARHGIHVTFCLFDDCAFGDPPITEPYLGKQREPQPGEFMPAWTPSPGLSRVTDRSAWPRLQKYVKDVVGRFAQDRRVLIWDLYNEPGNSGMGTKSLPLAEAAFAWTRAAGPTQPLTTGGWVAFDSPMTRRLMELSDLITFHAYDRPDGVRAKIETCRAYGRPVICTEWLRRQGGNTFTAILPIFVEYKVGWYNWGLVAGRTQTYMYWGSKKGTPTPTIWQHDLFHPDHRPFDPDEIRQIRNFTFGN
jgi:hypothetical protein